MGLIARGIEKNGLSTVYLGSCRDMMARIRAPRSAFIDFPLGHQCGKPNDIDLQTQILKDTLNVLVTATIPGALVDLDYQWDEPFSWDMYQAAIKEMLDEEGSPAQEWQPKQ